VLLNAGASGVFGESIGNDLTRYTRAKLLVTVESEFSVDITDYLGSRILVSVGCSDGGTGSDDGAISGSEPGSQAQGRPKYQVQVSGLPEPYQTEVIEV
jgi:hypothetical protein